MLFERFDVMRSDAGYISVSKQIIERVDRDSAQADTMGLDGGPAILQENAVITARS